MGGFKKFSAPHYVCVYTYRYIPFKIFYFHGEECSIPEIECVDTDIEINTSECKFHASSHLQTMCHYSFCGFYKWRKREVEVGGKQLFPVLFFRANILHYITFNYLFSFNYFKFIISFTNVFHLFIYLFVLNVGISNKVY